MKYDSIPLMRTDEETDFDTRISWCGPGLAHSSLEEFASFNPDLGRALELNPDLEFRVLVDNHDCYTFVRQKDWANIQYQQRKRDIQVFWKNLPSEAIAAFIWGTVLGLVCLVLAFGAHWIFGLKPNYGFAFLYGLGFIISMRTLQLCWQRIRLG